MSGVFTRDRRYRQLTGAVDVAQHGGSDIDSEDIITVMR